jgi:ribosomal protein S18 acetylase RimI-like enzyme
MAMAVTIARLYDLPADLVDLIAASGAEGFRFLRRLADDWRNGTNSFSRPGEALFAAAAEGRTVGICGLNIDPYIGNNRIGRVRHLYVAAEFRRRSVGTKLVAAVIEVSHGTFDRLRLRTTTEAAANFYEALGFRCVTAEPGCTHVLDLQTRSTKDEDEFGQDSQDYAGLKKLN